MSKVLVIFIVVLASYLVVDEFVNNDDSIELNEKGKIKLSVTPSVKSNTKRIEPEVIYEIEHSDTPETDLFDSEYIEATYAVELDDKHIKAALRFSFYEDGTFSDYRDMTFPKSIAGETTGTYSIEGAILSLIYGEERDKNVFTFNQAKMSLHKDGTLRSGTIVLTKQ